MAKCIRCGQENPWQDSDYRCYSCFGENSPRMRWTDPPPDSAPPSTKPAEEAPETWPPHWRMTKSAWGHDIIHCSKHNETFAKTDKCSQCRSVAKAKATVPSSIQGQASRRIAQALGGIFGTGSGSGQSTPLQTPSPKTLAMKFCNKHGCAYSGDACALCIVDAWKMIP